MAESSLFRSKRAKQLAMMLTIRKLFQKVGLSEDINVDEWRELFTSSAFRQAVRQIVRVVKTERVGIAMMDISICVAIAPYNSLLGGKLVALLLCSPEIVKEYEARYGQQTSVIASGMRGATELIADYWRQRWLLKRISKPGLLADAARHTCVYPMRHGAQVEIPADGEMISDLWVAADLRASKA